MALTNYEFYIITPKEATNLITNPSVEIDITGYSATSSTLARVTTQQRRGVASLQVTPNINVEGGVYRELALTISVVYSYSVDVLTVLGQTYNLFINDHIGTRQSALVSWVGNGHWQRRGVTYTSIETNMHYFVLVRLAVPNTTPFYVDGWQLEVGAQSTYLDGDMKGFVRTQTDYLWTGIPHVSTSYRSGQTRSGGIEVRLRSYLNVLAVLGLGLSPVINNTLPNVRGGAFYQNTILDRRTISIKAAIPNTGPEALQTARKAVINAINPKLTAQDQPMILRVKGVDDTGANEQAEPCDVICQYSGGLEGDWSETGIEHLPLQFQMYTPLLQNEGEKGLALTFNQSVANANYILKRDTTGLWQAISTGMNAEVDCIAVGPDGSIYVGGGFTNVGDANGDYIVKWTGSAWVSLGTGMQPDSNGNVRAIAFGPDGSLYAGGDFATAGGVANTRRIAKWNGSVWSALGTGGAATIIGVRSIVFGPDGTLYAGGSCTSFGGVANTAYVAKWNGAAWSAMSTGAASDVYALVVGLDGAIYCGGIFANLSGVSNTTNIGKWTGSAWVSVGTGGITGSGVQALLLTPDGSIYAGGTFTAAGGVTVSNIARYNGSSWAPLGNNVFSNWIYCLAYGLDGNIYIGGFFSTVSPLTPPDALICWNGSSFVFIDVDLPGSPAHVYALTFDKSNNLLIGWDNTGSATAAYVTSALNAGSGAVYPRFTITGPGTVYQIKNVTSGKTIYLNLILNAGETATLDLNPDNPTFVSSFRGNLKTAILAGSSLDLALLPGYNNISIFVAGTTTAATAVTIIWRESYESLDGAKY